MSECYGCINPNAACPSCKKNFDRMFAERASTKGHQMNRDREAIARIIDPNIEHLPRINLHRSQIEDAYAKADAILALPVGGGVELRDTIRGLRVRWGHAIAAGKPYLPLYTDELELILAALSPTTLGGGIQGRLAAKDGAAAPPQAPVEDQ